jgi:hypothetical protein
VKLLPDPRRRLRELAAARRVSLTGLSRMLERPDHYLGRYARQDAGEQLPDREITILSRFFAVPDTELGASDPRWSRWREYGARLDDRKLGRST